MKNTSIVVMLLTVLTLVGSTAFAHSPSTRDEYLAKIDWQKVEKSYIGALMSENIGVRKSATGYLAEYRLRGGIQPLIALLKEDKVEQIRMAAALALIMIGEDEGKQAVQDAVLYDGSEKVAKFCESLLTASPDQLSFNNN
jgi:hypothetical protein